MKRKIIIILASITGAALLLAASFAACANLTAKAPSGSDTESNTVELPSHLSPDEPQESSSDSGSSTLTEDPTEEASETEESDENSDNESGEDSETEEPPAPVLALDYVSHGNGTCSVSGIGNIIDSYVTIPLRSPDGDVVTSIEEKAFCGNEFIRAVEIPSTISYIGDMAFSDCPELVYLSVDKNNKAFCDVGGILFTADMTRLIAYPSASGTSTISIPSSVIKISPMAFFGCNNLKTIEYQGTAAQWSKIAIEEMNYGLFSTSIICTDTAK